MEVVAFVVLVVVGGGWVSCLGLVAAAPLGLVLVVVGGGSCLGFVDAFGLVFVDVDDAGAEGAVNDVTAVDVDADEERGGEVESEV